MQYNSNYFDQGSVPPGILVLVGNYSQETLDQMNEMWEVDTKGIVGQHKPVAIALEPGPNGGGGGAHWLQMKTSNRDMEMGDFLDKLSTKIASISLTDPVEIGHRVAASKGGMSDSDNTEAKIDLSRDKGLVPMLDLIEETNNHNIMPHLAPGYVFRFTGINTADEEKKVKFLNDQKGITYREYRKALGLDEEPENYDKNDLGAPTDPNAQKIWMMARGLGLPQPAQNNDDEEEENAKPELKSIPGGKKTEAKLETTDKSWAAY